MYVSYKGRKGENQLVDMKTLRGKTARGENAWWNE